MYELSQIETAGVAVGQGTATSTKDSIGCYLVIIHTVHYTGYYMYFENRTQAGQLLAGQLIDRYRYENCVVIALSDGAVLVGEQIAWSLHCVLTMLLVEDIQVQVRV